MGQRGSADCKCGYGESVTLGGGRSNHLWFAGYPYICRSCCAVFTGNLYEEASSCRHCESSDTSSYEDAATIGFVQLAYALCVVGLMFQLFNVTDVITTLIVVVGGWTLYSTLIFFQERS